MDKDDEYRLIRLAQAGDRDAAGELIVQHHWKLVGIARRTKARGLDFDDKYQLACLYFLKSLQKFDCRRGVRLSTYTYSFIEMNVRRDAYCIGFFKLNPNAKKAFSEEARAAMSPLHSLNIESPGIMAKLAISDAACDLDDREEQAVVLQELDRLPTREKLVVRWRMRGLTFRQIAVMLDVTYQRVKQIEAAAIKRIRWSLNVRLTPQNKAV